MSRSIVALLACGALAACGGSGSGGGGASGIVAKGSRELGVDVQPAEDGNFDAAFQLARAAGLAVEQLPLAWDSLETAPGTYDGSVLAMAEAYYPSQGTSVALGIHPIDTTIVRLPADLQGLAFDDPTVIARFDALLDWVFTQIPLLQLHSLSIGNEIDATLGTDAALWSQYQSFFAATSAHARLLRASLRVGTKVTAGSVTGAAHDFVQQIQAGADAVFVTCYPLNPDFTVQPPSTVRTVFDAVCAAFSGRTVEFHELGYPSGALGLSSEALQAQFVHEAFKAWDEHAAQVPFVNFTWLTDLSPAAVAAFGAYYGSSDPIFLDYLGSLGLRTYTGSGTDKAGWTMLVGEAAKRGW